MTPRSVAEALRAIAGTKGIDPMLDRLRKLALSIDGPMVEKKDSGNGGKSPPTVTLSDVGITESGGVKHEWTVYANGQKVVVVSVTNEDGDSCVSGQDLDLDGLTAQQAIAFILQKAPTRYYPHPGKTVVLDDDFISNARNVYPTKTT